jgi:hypothetical protein
LEIRLWDVLSDSDKEEVRLVVRSLQAFEAASRFIRTNLTKIPPDLMRFMEAGRYVYAVAYFHKAEPLLLPVFERLGVSNTLGPTLKLLEKPYGNTTLLGLLTYLRNKMVAHPASVEKILTRLRSDWPGVTDAKVEAMTTDIAYVFDQIEMIADAMQRWYPQAVDNGD